jgi:two-component system chemotaxis sensor kinase CheA
MALFHQELEERSAALVEAGRLLLVGTIDAETIDDVIRDAHTIKGSARLMANEPVATGAAVLEGAWRAIAVDRLEPTTEVAASMIDLAGRLGKALDLDGGPGELAKAVTRAQRAVGAVGVSGDENAGPEPSALGGLLSTVTASLLDGVTRVETGELYRLINRLVEVALDISAVADLSLVSVEGADPKRLLTAWRGQMERLTESILEVQDRAVALANVPFREVAETFPQFLRYLGRKLGKDVRIEISGEDVELDRQIVEQLREPLRHLIVNAVDHGLETPDVRRSQGKPATGTVSIRALLREDRAQISITDDGAGVDWDAVEARAKVLGLEINGDIGPVLLKPEFSIRTLPDDFSGTGEGLSVVADAVERIHGSMQIESVPGQGTTVLLTLPVSLVLQNMVVVAAGDQFWGLPEPSVIATMSLSDPRIELFDAGRHMGYEGSRIPVISLGTVLGVPPDGMDQEVAVVTGRAGLVAVTVPEVVDRRRVAVKGLGPILDGAPHIAAAAFLGGGEVLVVIDPNYLADHARSRPTDAGRRPSILVVDDSAGVRQLIAATLSGAGFDVVVAAGAREAVGRLSESGIDALVVDYSMPRSSGVDLVRALRAADVTLPIVMVSGVATPEEQKAAWDAGVDVYMDKFDLRKGVLTTTLRRLLAEHHGVPV